jgi:hypothetical protein
MRKVFSIFATLIFAASEVAFGQLEVKSDGRVNITPSGNYGLYANVAPSGNIQSSPYGLYGCSSGIVTINPKQIVLEPFYSAGVKGSGYLKSGSAAAAVAFGVIGYGNGSTQGRNIGVFGYIQPSLQSYPSTPVYGAGVFGAKTFQQAERNFTQAYAGFFAGNVGVEGSVTATAFTLSSDARYKQNITDLKQNETYQNVLLLNPVEYNLRQRYTEYTDSTGNIAELEVFEEGSQLLQKKHYGLIAQEVRELYPDLVYEDGDGYLSVDYVGIIPLLISSVKELKTEIDELKKEGSAPSKAPQQTQQEELINESAALFQNTPNPFNESAEIAFYLPQSVQNAMLCIYDMNGRQLSQNAITQRGNASFVVNGSQYGAGMYLYSLIADNRIVDTKRMILTK